MVVKIRLAQHGKKHRPIYKIVAIDVRKKRQGRPLEYLGIYDPHRPQDTLLKTAAIEKWLKVGALCSKRTGHIIKSSPASIENSSSITE